VHYTNLPPVGSIALPDLVWTPTNNFSRREPGVAIEDVFDHVWGGGTFDGVISWFKNPASQASSHIVYAGEIGKDAGRCAQMVELDFKAWTEAADNSEGVSVEAADAIWTGHDPHGFARLARINGWLLLHEKLPGAWVRDPHGTHDHGLTRHADGGQADGGHTMCPTADLELWGQMVQRTKLEIAHGGYRTVWAR
jgi:hypothetical protein